MASTKRGGPLRPGREAAIIRRLLGQHEGALPRYAIVRIWREIFAASVAQQQSVLVAVCDPAMDGRFAAAAREHLGALTPLRVYRSAAQAIGEVVEGRAGAAILPLPGDGAAEGAADGREWWPGLLQQHHEGRIHVVARLPFWRVRPEGAPAVQALVIAGSPADPSGDDVSLIALEMEAQISPCQPRPEPRHGRLQAALHPSPPPARRARRPGSGGGRGLRGTGRSAPPLHRRVAGAAAGRRRLRRRDQRRDRWPMSVSRRPRPRPEIMAIDPYVGGASKVPGVSRIIKLSSNEGAFGPPPAARTAISLSADGMNRYPDGSATAMRQAIGGYFDLDPARIVCGNGSDEIINLLIQAYGGPGTELLMSAHGFSIYAIFGRLAGGTVIKVPEHDLVADIDGFLASVTARTRLVFLANPNNPTGALVPLPDLRRLREGLPPDVLLVLDGAYAEYVDRPDFDAGLSLVEGGENTVMTRTFSKIWGLGGARLGWGYGPAAIMDVLNRPAAALQRQQRSRRSRRRRPVPAGLGGDVARPQQLGPRACEPGAAGDRPSHLAQRGELRPRRFHLPRARQRG